MCGGDVTVVVLSKSGNTITVLDPTGLGVGMFLTGTQLQILSISGNVVTLNAAFAHRLRDRHYDCHIYAHPTHRLGSRNPGYLRLEPSHGVFHYRTGDRAGLSLSRRYCYRLYTRYRPVGNVGTTAYTCPSTLAAVVGTNTALSCPPTANGSVVPIGASVTTFGIKSLTNVGVTEFVSGA